MFDENPSNSVDVAERLIIEGDTSTAENILFDYIDSMPNSWSPWEYDGEELSGYFFGDTEEFQSFIKHHRSKLNSQDTIFFWRPGSFTKAHYLLAIILRTDNTWRKGQALLKNALTIEPDHPKLLSLLAAYHLDNDSVDLAVELYEKAATRRPWASDKVKAQFLVERAKCFMQTHYLIAFDEETAFLEFLRSLKRAYLLDSTNAEIPDLLKEIEDKFWSRGEEAIADFVATRWSEVWNYFTKFSTNDLLIWLNERSRS